MERKRRPANDKQSEKDVWRRAHRGQSEKDGSEIEQAVREEHKRQKQKEEEKQYSDE
jgi:hypothetical protein